MAQHETDGDRDKSSDRGRQRPIWLICCSTVDSQWIHNLNPAPTSNLHVKSFGRQSFHPYIKLLTCTIVAGVHSCKVGHSIAKLDVLLWNNEKAEQWEEVAIEGNQERTVTQIHRSTYSLLSFSFCSPHSDYSISRKWVGGWERTDWPPQPQGSTFGTFSFPTRGEIKNGTTLTSSNPPPIPPPPFLQITPSRVHSSHPFPLSWFLFTSQP